MRLPEVNKKAKLDDWSDTLSEKGQFKLGKLV